MTVTGFCWPAIVGRVVHDVGFDVPGRDAGGKQVEHGYVPALPARQDPTRWLAMELRGTRLEVRSATAETCPWANAL